MNPRVCRTTLALAAISAAVLAHASGAHAQTVAERLALHVEGGLGSMLSDAQRNQGYDFAANVGARIGIELFDPMVFQLAASSWTFPRTRGNGGEGFLGAGLRFEPRIGSVGRIFVDGDVGAALSGTYATGGGTMPAGALLSRTMIDLGFGFEFTPVNWFGVGPVIRYGRVIANADHDLPADAQFWSVGLSVSIRLPRRPTPIAQATSVATEAAAAVPPVTPPADGDHDGVPDHDDFCANDPAGEHPDPARLGCPLPDADHDGVPDATDACPADAQGAHGDPERPGCPDRDDDHDGVPNRLDACPTEPSGAHPDQDHDGCPLADADHDNVPDAADACPWLPATTETGCPAFATRGTARGAFVLTAPVAFVGATARLAPHADVALGPLAEALRGSPAIQTLAVDAHSDEGGAHAQVLAQQRAQAVVAWLVAHGVPAARLEAHGFGETGPVAPANAAAQHAQNRRVEFRVTAPALGGAR